MHRSLFRYGGHSCVLICRKSMMCYREFSIIIWKQIPRLGSINPDIRIFFWEIKKKRIFA